MYLTDSDTIKICWYWLDADTNSRIRAALSHKCFVHIYAHTSKYCMHRLHKIECADKTCSRHSDPVKQ